MKKLLAILCAAALPLFSDSALQEIEDTANLPLLSQDMAARKTAKIRLSNGLQAYLVSDPKADQSAAAMAVQASYLALGEHREPADYNPELSRRARGVELWAGLRSLGRSGMAQIVERTSAHARRFAAGLSAAGYKILNDVVINQVLVSFGTAERTLRTIARLQEEGTCWCGSTVWQGHTAMRISVSSWATTEEDVERSLAAMLKAAQE